LAGDNLSDAGIWQTALDSGGELLHQLAEIGEASAIIAAAAALIGLWLTFRESMARSREKEVLDWQKVIVYDIVSGRGPIRPQDILGFYLDQEQLFGISALKGKLLRGEALESILLSLVADNAIFILPKEDCPPNELLYAITRAVRHPSTTDTIFAMDARSVQAAKDTREVLYHIEKNNGRFTLLELKEYFHNILNFDDQKIDSIDDILLRLEMMFRMVARDKNGKIWRVWPLVTPPPAPPPPPPPHRSAHNS
jgi:hypothetical protein